MAQTASAAFKAAQAADVAALAQKVQLVLGDYANSNGYSSVASSSGDDASGDYPAAGAINGDRTEINVGAAATADDGIGKSSWKSSGIPDAGDFVWLVVDLGAAKTINRLKLYHRSGHGISSYTIEYSTDGITWDTLAVTSDFTGGGLGFGEGGFGDGPYGGVGGSITPTVVTTTKTLDIISTSDVSARYIRLIAGRTEVAAEAAQVVALEVYRMVDITNRCKSINVDRQRDYKMLNPMAASVELMLDNSDRFFSISHVPTAAETASGFVNSELRPGIGIVVQKGFYTTNGLELVNNFIGTLDGIRIVSKDRTATITGRDGIKAMIDQQVSTKLKSSQDIGDNAKYLLNLANISNYEMSVDNTTIVLDYFFVDEKTILSALQELVVACGDAQLYVDENGTVQFKMYMNSVPQSHTDTAEADFEAGTLLDDVDTTTSPGDLIGPVENTAKNPTLYGPWVNIVTTLANFTDIDGGYTTVGATISTNAALLPLHSRAKKASTKVNGGWRIRMDQSTTNTGLQRRFHFIYDEGNGGAGYFIQVYSDAGFPGYHIGLYVRDAAGADIQIDEVSLGSNSGMYFVIKRSASGTFRIYVDGVLQMTTGDTTAQNFNVSTHMYVDGVTTGGLGALSFSELYIINLGDALTATFDSQIIDQTAALTALGIFSSNTVVPAGSTLAFYTATSADGITFDAWVAASVGVAIASTLHRYIKWRAVFGSTFTGTDIVQAKITDATITWTTGAGSAKNHTSVDFFLRFDSSVIEVEQEMTDSLGGDTAIINDVSVKSAPLVLSGADADTKWQGTVSTPAAAISAGNPLTLAIGTYTYNAFVAGGMDTANMSGATPAALVCTAGTAVITSATISKIHPTRPVITIVVGTGGTITDLRLIGKTFSNSDTPYAATATDTASIAFYNRRSQSISNDYIINQSIAQLIANRLVLNYKAPTSYLPSVVMQPTYSMQLGDRANIVDENTDLSADYAVVGLTHALSADEGGAQGNTSAKLVKIT